MRDRKIIFHVLLAIVLLLVAALSAAAIFGCQQTEPETIPAQVENSTLAPAPDSDEASKPAESVSADAAKEIIAGKDLLSLTSLYPFAMGSATSELSEDKEKAIKVAITEVEKQGVCAFLVMDLDDGTGVAYNVDAKVYTASSIKIALVFYALQKDPNVAVDFKEVIEDTLIYSDNDAYDYLAQTFCTPEYIEWLASYGIIHDIDSENGPYPYASPKSMAAIWADIATYLDQDTEEAKWLSSILAETETSFIREAAIQVGATQVLDKAGWIAESIEDIYMWYSQHLDATNDCGIVYTKEHRYVVAIMTGVPYSEVSEAAVGNLTKVLLS